MPDDLRIKSAQVITPSPPPHSGAKNEVVKRYIRLQAASSAANTAAIQIGGGKKAAYSTLTLKLQPLQSG
jgi:hypothetical protein